MDSSKKSLDVVVGNAKRQNHQSDIEKKVGNTIKHKEFVSYFHAGIRNLLQSGTASVATFKRDYQQKADVWTRQVDVRATDFANFAFPTLDTSGNIRPLCNVSSTDSTVFHAYVITGTDIAVGRELKIEFGVNCSRFDVPRKFLDDSTSTLDDVSLKNATLENVKKFLQVNVTTALKTTENNAILNGGGVNSNTVGLLQQAAGIPIINFGHASELNDLSRLSELTDELPIVYPLQGDNPKDKSTWVMNRKTARHIASITGTDLALNDLSTGNAKLLDYDCIVNDAMPDNSIIFGNFYRGVILVDKTGKFVLKQKDNLDLNFIKMWFGYETVSVVVDKNALRIIKIAV